MDPTIILHLRLRCPNLTSFVDIKVIHGSTTTTTTRYLVVNPSFVDFIKRLNIL